MRRSTQLRQSMPISRIQRCAMAHLQQLACLNFNGPALIEAVLHELHHLIVFDTGGYYHPGSEGAMDAYIEPSLARDLMHLYFEPEVLATEHEVIRRSAHDFTAAVRYDHGAQVMEQLITVPVSKLLRSDFYNLALRPVELLDCLSLVLRTPQGAGVGALKLYRGPGAPRFGTHEAATLARLEPWLTRILQPGEMDAQDSVVQESAMLVATPQGKLLWTSPPADRLMTLAFGPRWRWRNELPSALQMLLDRLQFACRGKVTAPPQWELRNASGWFSLRITLMAAAVGESQAVGIHITQRVPRAVRLLHTLRALGLPQRQHELAYWLGCGLPEDEIASRMGISVNTAVYHRRQIYTRLGVQNRKELQAILVAQP